MGGVEKGKIMLLQSSTPGSLTSSFNHFSTHTSMPAYKHTLDLKKIKKEAICATQLSAANDPQEDLGVLTNAPPRYIAKSRESRLRAVFRSIVLISVLEINI